jgi:hypothetical protein
MRAKAQQDDFNVKLIQSLERIEIRWIRIHIRVYEEVAGLMMRKRENKKVLVIKLSGKSTVAQVHILSESIREGMGWTSYKGK